MRLLFAIALAVLAGSGPAIGTSRWAGGEAGGRLVAALRSDPKTFNPVAVIDAATREALRPLFADLIHIDRETHDVEPALAQKWTVSPDGRVFDVELRPGLRFSDGAPITSADVVFTFEAFLDEKVGSPQRDLLIVGGKPMVVRAVNATRVRFEFAAPYAVGARLFDGFPILPRHVLEDAYRKGTLQQAWTLATPANQIVTSGAFRVKSYAPGSRLVYERNPHYWKTDDAGVKLPYLQELVFTTVPSEDTQLLQFNAGAIDVVNRLSPEHFDALGRGNARAQALDAGAGLEYNFLFFNLNDTADGKPAPGSKPWFRDARFRRAASFAVDRDALVRLAYRGRGAALWSPVTPGNRRWQNHQLASPTRSIAAAKQLLTEAGFTWDAAGGLRDRQGAAVTFTIAVASSNAARLRMASLAVEDLRQLGMQVTAVPLEFRALVDRIYQTHDYDAAVVGFGSGDADPNSDIGVWLSDGSSHVWRLRGAPEPWQRQVDERLRAQLAAMQFAERKKLYDEAQALIVQHAPVVFLASPNILAAAHRDLGNFKPTVLEPYTLWNVDRLFWRDARRRTS